MTEEDGQADVDSIPQMCGFRRLYCSFVFASICTWRVFCSLTQVLECVKLTPNTFPCNYFQQNKVSGSSHTSGCLVLIPSERGKARTGAWPRALSTQPWKVSPMFCCFRSLPPKSDCVNDTWPPGWRGPSRAGQHQVSLPSTHMTLSVSVAFHSHTTLRGKWTQGAHLSSSKCSG